MICGIKWVRIATAAVIGVAASGCGSINPQTREEFKQLVVDSPKMGLTDTYTTNRRFEDVVRSLEAKWQECYNVARTASRSQGGITTMQYTEVNHPHSQKINNSLVEMTLQQSPGMTMLDKVPPGGYYFLALNAERLPANKTKLTWYSYWTWRHHWDRNKQWSDGNDVACDAE